MNENIDFSAKKALQIKVVMVCAIFFVGYNIFVSVIPWIKQVYDMSRKKRKALELVTISIEEDSVVVEDSDFDQSQQPNGPLKASGNDKYFLKHNSGPAALPTENAKTTVVHRKGKAPSESFKLKLPSAESSTGVPSESDESMMHRNLPAGGGSFKLKPPSTSQQKKSSELEANSTATKSSEAPAKRQERSAAPSIPSLRGTRESTRPTFTPANRDRDLRTQQDIEYQMSLTVDMEMRLQKEAEQVSALCCKCTHPHCHHGAARAKGSEESPRAPR